MDEASVLVSTANGVCTLEINRPQVMNAVAGSTVRELRAALAAARNDPEARVLVVTGRGRAFCTGADLSDPEIALDGALEERPAKLAVLMRETINPLMEELRSFPKPTIAAVNGPAVGGGIGIALSTDITIAASSAYFMQVFTPKLGLVPDMGVTWYLERLVGRARARGLAMLGDRLPAQEAADWGMIWKAVPDDMFSAEVTALANRIAGAPTLAMRRLSSLLDEAPSNDLATQLDRERAMQCELVLTQDAQEAVLAFREKRPPRFVGR
jgi:2-(1,2-epoxy-1,2-dihydrophenyl)acetyl-CoA isomerase